jgi:membrane glycosyltransferase
MSFFAISQHKPEVPALPESLWVAMPEQALHEKPLPMRPALVNNV